MMWSKLKRDIKNIMTDGFDIQCAVYSQKNNRSGNKMPRYFITFNGEIIWDFPKDFADKEGLTELVRENSDGEWESYFPKTSDTYMWDDSVRKLSDLMRHYLSVPRDDILQLEGDKFGLINVLRSSDRRLGRRTLEKLLKAEENPTAKRIIETRLEKQ